MSTLSIDDARDYLKIPNTDSDAELQEFIDSAEAAIVNRVGPLTAVAVTRQVRGGGTALHLPILPAISLTSVTPLGGTALTLSDLSLDTSAGMVTYVFPSVFWNRRYTVVYQAGRATVPDDLLLAIKQMVKHLWATQRGSGNARPRPQNETLSNTLPGSAYIFPIRVEQLLTPHISTTGFA